MKKKSSRSKVLIMAVILTWAMAGCGSTEVENSGSAADQNMDSVKEPQQEQQTPSQKEEIPEENTDETEAVYEAEVLEFSMGEAVMKEERGDVTFPLDGLIGIPEKENCPVVFILHGAHQPKDVKEDRFYRGFSYLVEDLAKKGYLTVAVNMNRAYSMEPFEGVETQRAYEMIQEYLEWIQKANDGEDVFEAQIKGKADLGKIHFIGHSRGGDNSLYIAKRWQEETGLSAASVLLVASPLLAGEEVYYTDIPTGIILPQYDGDVVGLETARLFNRIFFVDQNRQQPVTMAFLYGANHAMFNSGIFQEDVLAPPKDVEYIDGEEQRAFLSAYAADFLKVAEEKKDAVKLLGDSAPKRYGIAFMPAVWVPGGMQILPDEMQTGIKAEGVKPETKVFSQIPEKNTIAPFNLPGPIAQDITLYRLSWNEPGQSLTFDVPDGDWSSMNYLSMLVANDSTASESSDDNPVQWEIKLSDQEGTVSSVTVDGERTEAFRYLETPVDNLFEGMEGMPVYEMARFHTPLSTFHINLSEFQNIDLGRVAKVTIEAKSGTGACILGGIQISPGR